MDMLFPEQLLEFFNKLNAIVHEQVTLRACIKPEDPYESAETKEINTALAKAQAEYLPVGFNRENPYFKSGYADFSAIMKACRLALSKNGLSLTQQLLINDDGATILLTKLRHSSGQWISCRARIIPAKNDVQTFASTLTYMKRHSAATLLNIVVDADYSDDDAEVATISAREIIAKGPSNKYDPKQQSYESIGKTELEELEYELAEYDDLAETVLTQMHLQSLADMPKSKYRAAIERIREIKQLRNGTVPK